ncbi:MAG: tRNA (adenosine(37)-N6)-threonylcarbamoyltransferase complex ATPase subunit type 1 TsaE [Saprospiraceae bacterium]|nr:tRNA (adenosine(37)-N6)-threonylcarbamoyltransferase complex ATPase subunit type 1 TsaE [Saprospiraceae bacterium]
MTVQNTMDTRQYIGITKEDLPVAAKDILNAIKQIKLILFYGNLGAGKTSLIKELCNLLGYQGIVQSPTFSLVNHYQTDSGVLIHMDLYRIERTEEIRESGIDEYLDADQYCFIEWPQLIESLIQSEFATITLTVNPDQSRNIELKIIQGTA